MTLRLGPLAALAATALALAACSGSDGGDGATNGRLVVRAVDGAPAALAVTLDCAGADASACERIAERLDDLRPRDGEVCTAEFSGPERLVVSGSLDGERVDLELTRRDSCATARYALMARLLGG